MKRMKTVIAVALAAATLTGSFGTESFAQQEDDMVLTSIGGKEIPGGYSTKAVSSVNVTPKKKKMVVKWKKVKNASGYEVEYSLKKSFRASSSKFVKSGKTTIANLKSKKKYYVRVRSYAEANGVSTCGSWSAVKRCKVK